MIICTLYTGGWNALLIARQRFVVVGLAMSISCLTGTSKVYISDDNVHLHHARAQRRDKMALIRSAVIIPDRRPTHQGSDP